MYSFGSSLTQSRTQKRYKEYLRQKKKKPLSFKSAVAKYSSPTVFPITKKKVKILKLGYFEKLKKKTSGLKYPEFLKSKYWKAVRNIILKRDNYKCAVCQSTKQLQVHHQHTNIIFQNTFTWKN